MAQDPGISAPPTVQEGGSITIQVGTGVQQVWVGIPGQRAVRVPVRDGVAEYRVPPGVTGGTIIFISDMKLPNPKGTTTRVVGNQ